MTMANEPDLVVVFILDESGSMSGQAPDTIKGCNEYIDKLKADHQGERILFTLTQFNSTVRVVHNAELIEDIPHLTKETYVADGYTALYDAIGISINEVSKRVNQDSNVLVVIMTDGLENASKEFNFQQVKDLIEEKKQKEWSFVFMGADPTAQAVGESLGSQASVMYNAANMGATMQSMSVATQAYRGSRGSSAALRSAAYADAFSNTAGKNFDMDINRDIDDKDVIKSVYEDKDKETEEKK